MHHNTPRIFYFSARRILHFTKFKVPEIDFLKNMCAFNFQDSVNIHFRVFLNILHPKFYAIYNTAKFEYPHTKGPAPQVPLLYWASSNFACVYITPRFPCV